MVTSLLAPFSLSRNKISEAARLITHLQDMSSITGTFEEFWLKTPEHLFAEQISVAASWNYVIVSTFSLKLGLIQTFLNNILDSQ